MNDRIDMLTTYLAIRDAARNKQFISYGVIAKANNADWQRVRFKIFRQLGILVKYAKSRDWPMISAIVVNEENLKTGEFESDTLEGFIQAAKDAGFYDGSAPNIFYKKQQEAVFCWAASAPDNPVFPDQE